MPDSAFAPYRVASANATSPLRQGEILSDLDQFRLDLDCIGKPVSTGKPTHHPFAIIMSQDCDLEQDFLVRKSRKQSNKLIPSVLFCEVSTAENLRGKVEINSTIWRQIKINKDERYHFLEKVEVGADSLNDGLPEMAIDFKRYFTLPTDEVYRRIEIGQARRRTVLASPYLEHISDRFAYFLSRIALPEDHISE